MLAGGALRHQVHCAVYAGPIAPWAGNSRSVAATVTATGLDVCHSPEELTAWLDRFARAFGFSAARYAHLGHRIQFKGFAEQAPLRFLSTHGATNDPWRAGDPAAPKIFVSSHPFESSTRDDIRLPDRQRAWLSIERARGVEAAIVIPVQDHLSGPAYLTLLCTRDCNGTSTVREDAPEIIYLGIGFHWRAKEVLQANNGAASLLTDREISCLRHAASGASVPQTASSLGIATRTVELYFSRAVRKLGALNRVHAVALALGNGLVQL